MQIITHTQGSVYNLRKELARQIWLSRTGEMDVLEALENTRDLVILCPADVLDIADRLQHKILNQITKKYGKVKAAQRGIDMPDVRVGAVKTREYLSAIRLPVNMIG